MQQEQRPEQLTSLLLLVAAPSFISFIHPFTYYHFDMVHTHSHFTCAVSHHILLYSSTTLPCVYLLVMPSYSSLLTKKVVHSSSTSPYTQLFCFIQDYNLIKNSCTTLSTLSTKWLFSSPLVPLCFFFWLPLLSSLPTFVALRL